MLDPNKSALLERTAAFVAVAIVIQVFAALALPYLGAHYGITLNDSDRALVGQVVSAIINVFLLLVGYFFGTTANRRQTEDTINKMATTQAASQEALKPIVAVAAPIVAAAAAKANPVKPDGITQQAWDAMTDVEKESAAKANGTPSTAGN